MTVKIGCCPHCGELLGGTYVKVEQDGSKENAALVQQYSDEQNVLHTTASLGNETWPVEIKMDGGLFVVSAKATRMELHITKVSEGYLISVPNMHCCGIVPFEFNAYDICNCIRLKNHVDVASLAAAVRCLIKTRML